MSEKEALAYPVAGAGQSINIGATSVQSAVLSCSAADITASSACWIEFGINPTAVKPTGYYLIAGAPYRFKINPGDLVAVIQDSAPGVLNICPVNRYV